MKIDRLKYALLLIYTVQREGERERGEIQRAMLQQVFIIYSALIN